MAQNRNTTRSSPGASKAPSRIARWMQSGPPWRFGPACLIFRSCSAHWNARNTHDQKTLLGPAWLDLRPIGRFLSPEAAGMAVVRRRRGRQPLFNPDRYQPGHGQEPSTGMGMEDRRENHAGDKRKARGDEDYGA